MVWVHGGGWIYEGTEDPLYSGEHLAARGDVVVVSMEYRLGIFGFSHFGDIAGSGNAGLLDQKLALEWVRDHIEAFGGDPNDVTLFGESAGGMSATALMGMPSAKGQPENGMRSRSFLARSRASGIFGSSGWSRRSW